MLMLKNKLFQSPSGDSLIWKVPIRASLMELIPGFQSPSGDSLIWKIIEARRAKLFYVSVPFRGFFNLKDEARIGTTAFYGGFSPLPGIL